MIACPIQHTRKATLVELRRRISAWEGDFRFAATPCISTGCDALDALFPLGGIRRGSLVEWVADGAAAGAGMMALLAGRRCCEAGRPAILIEGQSRLYPPALAALGFDLASLVLVHPKTERETLWACEESLRCQAVAWVWTRVERLTSLAFRRLQLAAEESGVVGFLVRPKEALREPSWADVRFLVTPRPSGGLSPTFRVAVARCHGQIKQAAANIAIDARRGELHETLVAKQTHRMSLVS
jgi:protein ImuA